MASVQIILQLQREGESTRGRPLCVTLCDGPDLQDLFIELQVQGGEADLHLNCRKGTGFRKGEASFI